MAEERAVVDLIGALGRATGATFVQIRRGGEPVDPSLGWPNDAETNLSERSELVALAQQRWASSDFHDTETRVATLAEGGWQLAVMGFHGEAMGSDVLVVGRPGDQAFDAGDFNIILAFARLVPVALEEAGITSPLDDLVTHLATELMSVSARHLQVSLQRTVRVLTEFFGVSTAFLRRNDHEQGVTILVCEWPIRENVPDPDPIGVVPFEGPNTDFVFAATRELREPMVIRPSDSQDDYQERVHEAAGTPPVALAVVPLLRDAVTTGVLGFVNFGDRVWSKAELNALRAIASLLSQLEGRVQAEQRLALSAYRDELTGLPNRRALLEVLRERLTPGQAPVTIAFADLDRLKYVNDSLGHGTGDALLREVAQRLQAAIGPTDLVARLGGDEFVLVFGNPPGDPLRATVAIVEGVTKTALVMETAVIPLAMSAGVAIGAPGELTAEDVLHRADVALLEAKKEGTDRVLLFNDEMLASSARRREINIYLPSAVTSGALEVHYLPEVDLRDGKFVAVEALVRWRHPTLGLVQPTSFIQVAEESPARIAEIGEWVLCEATRQLAVWHREFPTNRLVMRVNVSPVQLMSVDVAAIVSDALEAQALEGSDLCLEVAESAVLREMDHVLRVLRAVRQVGVRVALDDFGTGYSTLSQLKWLPVDCLKIDRQFITELGQNPEDLAIVESTVLLARSFGLEVVAEGLESVATARELVRLGCYRAAGHLIHPAAPADVITKLLAQERASIPDLIQAAPTD